VIPQPLHDGRERGCGVAQVRKLVEHKQDASFPQHDNEIGLWRIPHSGEDFPLASAPTRSAGSTGADGTEGAIAKMRTIKFHVRKFFW